MQLIKTIDKALIGFNAAFLAFAVAAMVLFTAWQVLARYVLHISVPYAEEFARLAVVWCIYFGAALAVRFREHMNVVALTNILPKPVQLLLSVLTNVMIVYLAYVLVRYGIAQVIFSAGDFTTSLGYHRNVFYLPAPIARALIGLYTIANIVIDIRAFLNNETVQSGEAPEV
jgi:TRAP-type C4-dicarboxylate transport system permease small subunit